MRGIELEILQHLPVAGIFPIETEEERVVHLDVPACLKAEVSERIAERILVGPNEVRDCAAERRAYLRSVSTGTPSQYCPRKRIHSPTDKLADFLPRSSGSGRSATSPESVTKAGLSRRRVTVKTWPFSSSSSEKLHWDSMGRTSRLEELVSLPPGRSGLHLVFPQFLSRRDEADVTLRRAAGATPDFLDLLASSGQIQS